MTDKPDSIGAWLAQLGRPSADRDYHPGHARMHALLEGLPLQRPRLRIRVAGTNGKGSTATMLAAALTASGYKVGLYTSPHLRRFNERIRIDGEEVEDAVLTACLQRLMPAALRIGASYFEVATAMALACFSKAGVDIEILEAGVGARLDATTAVPADAALLTPIGFDHQAWLGDTLEAIASEKAWAMDGCAVALSSPQIPPVMRVLQAQRPDMVVLDAAEVDAMPQLRAVGGHQRLNAALAWRMARLLAQRGMLALRETEALAAIAATDVPGRLQRLDWGGRRIWLDVGHNLHAVEALVPSLAGLSERFQAIVVLTREDRDLAAAAAMLQPLARHLFIRRGNERETVFRALDENIASNNSGDFLVMGSFITIDLASEWLDRMRSTAA
jgi:dihydrofolate synthase / folylpolyglutamate synthase